MDFSIKINKRDGPNKHDGGKILKVFLYFFPRKMKILQQIFQYINVHGEKVMNHHENKHFF